LVENFKPCLEKLLTLWGGMVYRLYQKREVDECKHIV